MWFAWITLVVQWGRGTRTTEAKAWDEVDRVCVGQVKEQHESQAETLGHLGSQGACEEFPAVAQAFPAGSRSGLMVTASR